MSTERKPSGLRVQQCVVCKDEATGFHFNAYACSACSAFFRRSLSEQKSYSCVPKNCDVSILNRRTGIVCKFCRFLACINCGMRCEEVQGKRTREPQKKECKSSPSECSNSPDRPASSESPNSYSSVNSIPKRRLPTVQRSRVGLNSSSLCPFLNEICNKRRQIDIQRSQTYKSSKLTAVMLFDLKEMFSKEKVFFSQLMQLYAPNDSTIPCEKVFYRNFLAFETLICTLRYGGPQTSRIYLTNYSFLDVMDESVSELFRSYSPEHHQSLTKLAMPVLHFFLDNFCRPVQAHHFDELEIAALVTLLISLRVMPPPLEAATLRHRVFIELYQHYVGREQQDGVRVGNLFLVSTTFEDLIHNMELLDGCFQLVNQ
ncbi:Nuclear receptor domain-containing protein [Aphelenchoides besseyi]|nr:Nuclear receptor domain-containing protein [Aphelenchoides besseyi]